MKMKGLSQFSAFFDRVLNLMFYIASGISLVIFFSVCTELFMRNFLNRPQIWSVEVTEYSMLYITFLGAAWLLREEGHVSLDVVDVLVKPRTRALLNSATSIIGLIVCLVLLFFGTWSTWIHYEQGLETFSAMELLKWPFLLVIPLGSLLLVIQFSRRAYGHWVRFRSYDIER